ncbi:hypothetical protein [Paraburkholderia caballeronis]|uniref:hypothetical protein n=1 Tax=Paraburkholderia caballeronis TaxID=416943 RepID=UPI001160079A|nr:hypothetical protein [Paraburkholderia caballeronis]
MKIEVCAKCHEFVSARGAAMSSLAAVGGSSNSSSAANESVTLNGLMKDGPIPAAEICLYADGRKASVADLSRDAG